MLFLSKHTKLGIDQLSAWLIIGVGIQHFSNYWYLYFLCPTADKRIHF